VIPRSIIFLIGFAIGRIASPSVEAEPVPSTVLTEFATPHLGHPLLYQAIVCQAGPGDPRRCLYYGGRK
jgi:hypothetical protein